MSNDVKQVLVIRKDLNMRKGKIAAQASHSSMQFITKRLKNSSKNKYECSLNEYEINWLNSGTTKIVVSVNSEKELFEIMEKAKSAGITVNLVTDAGRTEFNGVPTNTCIAIGPWDSSEIDKITKHLPLM
ncbi:MAG: aminoacyl-tRNA hydrolase [Chitinophagales bacterium]|nr:aminoacyl-tRNA hydrolase [Chitinophagales bacterium]